MRLFPNTLVAFIVAAGICASVGVPPAAAQCKCGTDPIPEEAGPADELVEATVYTELGDSSDGRAYVIVRLSPVGRLNPARLAEHQAAVQERQDAVLARFAPGRFTPVHKYQNVAAMTGYVDAEGLAQLAADRDVLGVGSDARGRGTLTESVPFIEADIVRDLYCYTGEGITVAVLDTGVDTDHADLADDVVAGGWHFLHDAQGYPYSGPGAEDDNGHGTNVAGVITSAGAVAPPGVAPDADILPIKVLDADNSCWMADVAAGVDYVVSVQHEYDRLAVINMSLGSDLLFEECPCDDAPYEWNQLLRDALDAARDAGIVSFAASGNDGNCWAMSSPACLSSVAAVAAVYDQDYGPQNWWGVCEDPTTYPDLVTCFSNRSFCNELAAPGCYITAPGMGGGTSLYSGTSQATPHCSGVAALMLQADQAWQLTPCIIRDTLKALGQPTDDPCDWNPNPRRVDARQSVDVVVNAPIELAELLASDGGGGDWFGYSAAIDGDIAVVGARLDDPNDPAWPWAGSAYVFRFDGSTWVEEAKLLASDPHNSAEFGWSVAVSGDTIVIGTPQHAHNGVQCGSAYVFWYDGANWIQQAELLASDRMPGDGFGCAVAIGGDHVLVGAAWDDNQNGNGAGAVYYFTRSGSSWTETQKLLATDSNGQYVDDRFGYSVAMQGSFFYGWKAAIGAPGDDDNGNGAGAAYVFFLGGSEWFQDAEGGKLLASDGALGDSVGWSVDIYGGRYFAYVVSGAPYDDDPINGQNAGSAYLFYRPFIQGVPWSQVGKAVACDGAPGDYFGSSVAISSSLKTVIGAPMDDDNGENSGSAYLLSYVADDESNWFQQAKLRASDGGPGDYFGNAVAMAPTTGTAVIGAHGHSCMGPGAGAAYVFANGLADCNNNGYPDDCDIENGTSADCNGNARPDECDIADGTSEDCNDNGVPDECDIAGGFSQDCQPNGVPDECELLPTVVIEDHYNDQLLDPAWSITFEDATGWEYTESGTLLTVTDISPAAEETWAAVTLSRACSAVADFQVSFDFSWDSEGSNQAIQRVHTSLLDRCGEVVARAGYYDAWVEQPGAQLAQIREDWWQSGYGTLPLAGSASIGIDRTDGVITISWDGSPILSGSCALPVEEVAVSFCYGAYESPWYTSFFGSESVDLVRLTTIVDCNENGVPDECDIADGTSADFNANGVPDECECLGDLDDDGDIDLSDLNALLAAYGCCDGDSCYDCYADLNGDGDVNLSDLATLLAHYGTTCP